MDSRASIRAGVVCLRGIIGSGNTCRCIHKGYLVGVRQAQVEKGFPDPNWDGMNRLGQVLKGILRH